MKGKRYLYSQFFFEKDRFKAETMFLSKLRNCRKFKQLEDGGHREYFFGDVEKARKQLLIFHRERAVHLDWDTETISKAKKILKLHNSTVFCPHCKKLTTSKHIIWCIAMTNWTLEEEVILKFTKSTVDNL